MGNYRSPCTQSHPGAQRSKGQWRHLKGYYLNLRAAERSQDEGLKAHYRRIAQDHLCRIQSRVLRDAMLAAADPHDFVDPLHDPPKILALPMEPGPVQEFSLTGSSNTAVDPAHGVDITCVRNTFQS